MNIEIPEVTRYAETFTSAESPLLQRINRETHAEVRMPRMLSGHLQGRFLAMVSCMLRPQLVLEIGTYTGYSALCLAEGLPPKGRLVTIDNNYGLEKRVRGYFAESPLGSLIDFHIGDARTLVPAIPGPFDLVFIDADKESYAHYFDLVIDKVRPGGFLLADNVLWSGKVMDPQPDKATKAIQEFNKKVRADPRVQTMLLPLRDGVLIMRRI